MIEFIEKIARRVRDGSTRAVVATVRLQCDEGIRRATAKPAAMPADWVRGHIAHYREGIPGHAGELRELTVQP